MFGKMSGLPVSWLGHPQDIIHIEIYIKSSSIHLPINKFLYIDLFSNPHHSEYTYPHSRNYF